MTKTGPFLLGTDIGTSLTKTVIVDVQGREIASAASEYGVRHPHPLWAEQWPDVWLHAFIATTRAALAKADVAPEEIAAVGISGLYGGSGIPLSAKMEPLRPCIIWMDRRAVKEVDWLRSSIDPDELFEVTGNGVDTYYGFAKMLWIKRNEPEHWTRIHKLVAPHDYIIYRLTNELAIDQSAAGNIGGVFDLRARRWSARMCQKLGIPEAVLPERIVGSTEVVGTVTTAGAKLSGLAAGTPLISGGIDAAVATLSAGAFNAGNHVAMIGTSMCWGIVHRGENVAPRLVSMPYVAYPSEMVYTFGGAATAGALLRWFRDEFGKSELALAAQRETNAYALLDEEAAKLSAGAEGLIVLPYFMGERSPIWDSSARGTILGLTLSHTRAHVYRALLEGVAFALLHNIEAGLATGLQLDETCVLVGGAAKSTLWRQILSDVTGYRMVAAQGSEAALGDALLAGIGVGLVDRFEAIRDWVEFEAMTTPDPEAHAVYTRLFAIYKATYPSLRALMHLLSAEAR